LVWRQAFDVGQLLVPRIGRDQFFRLGSGGVFDLNGDVTQLRDFTAAGQTLLGRVFAILDTQAGGTDKNHLLPLHLSLLEEGDDGPGVTVLDDDPSFFGAPKAIRQVGGEVVETVRIPDQRLGLLRL
jgi:hypothetical protein